MRQVDAKVATVLDDESIAINVGSQNDVTEGARVVLLQSVTVPDPDDPGHVLGKVLVERGQLRISEVHENFSVARVVRVSPLNKIGMPMFAPPQPQFKIAKYRGDDGPGRFYVSPKDPVTVFLDDE